MVCIHLTNSQTRSWWFYDWGSIVPILQHFPHLLAFFFYCLFGILFNPLEKFVRSISLDVFLLYLPRFCKRQNVYYAGCEIVHFDNIHFYWFGLLPNTESVTITRRWPQIWNSSNSIYGEEVAQLIYSISYSWIFLLIILFS